MLTERKRWLLDELWRDRMHVDPRTDEALPPAVRDMLQSIWEPALRMRNRLSALPEGLLALWHSSGRGHLLFSAVPSGYSPGEQVWQGQTLDGLCVLSIRDVMLEPLAAMVATGDLINHLLGSGAQADGGWFADGYGATPALQEAAQVYVRIHALGYGTDEHGSHSPREYLSRTWALYMTDPRRLNVMDPLVYRLYHGTLMSERFWRSKGASHL